MQCLFTMQCQFNRSDRLKHTFIIKHVLGLIVILFCFGCTLANVKVDVASERTTLENQVLGSYNAIDREMLLVASVRGVDSNGEIRTPPKRSQDQKDVLSAMQTLAFHEDDLQAFKRLGWAGEGNDGLLAGFARSKTNLSGSDRLFADRYGQEEFASVLRQVNQAREAVIRRVVDINDGLTEADLPEIRRVFARINHDKAMAGEKIQAVDGTWVVKP